MVLDKGSRRRIILPIGWGPRHVPGQGDAEEEGGTGVSSVVARCVKGVEWLCSEAADEAVEDVEMGMGESEGIVMAAL